MEKIIWSFAVLPRTGINSLPEIPLKTCLEIERLIGRSAKVSKVVGIKVVFLGDDDEDDYEDEGDCCGVCGDELEEDGTCDYCSNEENEN